MTVFSFRRRRTRRWWYSGAALMVAALSVVFYAGGASANLGNSKFEGGDGNLAVNTSGNQDWNSLSTASGSTPQLHIGTEFASGSGDNAFGQGTKENDSKTTLVTGSIPPQKSDLTRFYEASDVVPGYSDGSHVLLYLAWERSNVLGNANMDFEVNKVATPCLNSTSGFPVRGCTINRSVGDILVTYDFGGSGTPTIGIRTWDGSSWQPDTGTIVSESAVNSTTVTDSRLPGTNNLAAGTFGEAAIDLTASDVVDPGSCDFGQATTFLKSRSASSFTSEIKDFVSPISTPLVPCKGAIQVTKLAKNHNCTGAGTTSTGTDASCTGDATQAQAGASFQFYRETNDCTGLQTSSTTCADGGPKDGQTVSADTLVSTQSTVLSGSGATAAATACVSDLTLGTYYIHEDTPVSGFAAAADQTASVSAEGDCTSGYVSKTFTDQPLTNLTVTASSVVTGATNSSITCQDSSNNNIGNSPQPASGKTDPVTLTADSSHGGALTPGTYTCTVVIDP
jgi:hypothetical protein